MRVFEKIPEPGEFKNPVLTIGNFDGVHLGHQKILSTLLLRAEREKGEPVVLTFSSHPRKILQPGNRQKIITSSMEKARAIWDFGIRNIILLDFTPEIADMDALNFYNHILIEKIGVKHIVIGYDHAFGKNRQGNLEFLTEQSKRTGVDVTRVDEKKLNSKPVSSTWLRKEIENGNIHMAAKLLGRRYSIAGTVVKGVGRGSRQLGFPTANIMPEHPDKLLPKDGVYAVKVYLDDGTKKEGMLNLGCNPTFDAEERTVEVNIFDFDRDIYGAHINVEFHDWVRNEMKFPGPEELVSQITRDRSYIMNILKQQ